MRPIRVPNPTPRPVRSLLRHGLSLAVVAGLLGPAHASGQSEGILPRASQLPGSTRAMALGDAYAMSSGQADALYYHPALLTGSGGFGVELQRWTQSSTAASFTAATQWLGGGVGLGLRMLQYGAPGPDEEIAPLGQDHLFTYGPAPVSERILTLAYARELFWDVSFGVSMDLVDERAPTDSVNREGVALFDLSAARDFGSVVVGVTVNDLGHKPILDSGDRPSRVMVGAGSYGRPVGPLDVGFAVKAGVDDDEFAYGGGIEVGYWPVRGRTFVARVGFQDVPEGSEASPLTFGLAFWGDEIVLEWSFRHFAGADEGGTHRFGLSWR